MLIEQDLQSALRAFDNANAPDVDAARARLDAALDGRQTVARRAGATVLRPNHWRQRAIGAAAAAACIGAVFAGGRIVNQDRGAPATIPSVSSVPTGPTIPARSPSPVPPTPTAPHTRTAVQRSAAPPPASDFAAPKPVAMPGTTTVLSITGYGSHRIVVPPRARTTDPDKTVFAFFSCRGPGEAGLYEANGDGISSEPVGCRNESAGQSIGNHNEWLQVTAAGATKWRVDLVVSPRNAGVDATKGVDRRLTRGPWSYRIAHRGTYLSTTQPVDQAGTEYLFSCASAGVGRVSFGQGVFFAGCVPGYTYHADASTISPHDITVSAKPDTRWTLVRVVKR